MSDLVEFLRARLDEDEEIARCHVSMINPGRGDWQFVTDSGMEVRDASGGHLIVTHTWPNEGKHIARWDPAHVLTDIDAKRRIIEFLNPTSDMPSGEGRFVAEAILRLLALPYADHPDHRDEWKP